MMNDEATIPPRQPNTPRNLLRKLIAAVKAHPDRAIAFVLGFLAGAVLL